MAPMKSWVGGIAGLNIGTISKCVSIGTIRVTQTNGNEYPVYVGGIAGEIQKFGGMGGVLKECLHAGKNHSNCSKQPCRTDVWNCC